MIKISIIVPVYNTGKYLKKCLNSLINQTLDDIEIIVINDCSIDNSKEILNEYEGYNNIKIIHNITNKGIGYSRNLGLKYANGKYILFIDSDDFVDNTMCEMMYNKAENDNLDLVICRFHKLIERENGVLQEVKPTFNIPCFENTALKDNPSLLLQINSAPWNKLYRSDLFSNDIKFPENLKYEDAIVVVKTMIKSKKIGMLEDKLNYYLVREKSESTVIDKRVFDIITINKQILHELKKQEYYEDIKDYVEAKIVRSLLHYIKQQKYQKNQLIADNFKKQALLFLNNNFPNWNKKDDVK